VIDLSNDQRRRREIVVSLLEPCGDELMSVVGEFM
jgi:hypothetical protein